MKDVVKRRGEVVVIPVESQSFLERRFGPDFSHDPLGFPVWRETCGNALATRSYAKRAMKAYKRGIWAR